MLALSKGLFDQYAQPFRLGKFQNYLLPLINPCFQPMQIYPAHIKKTGIEFAYSWVHIFIMEFCDEISIYGNAGLIGMHR